MLSSRLLIALLALFVSTRPAWSLQIQLDYTYDVAGANFFGSNSAARQTLERAAADLNALIATPLVAVPTDVYTGTKNQTKATIDWSVSFTNPTSSAAVTLSTFTLPADVVRVYVGMQPLSGTTLGQGGPAGAGYDIGLKGSQQDFTAAIRAAESASNAKMTRGQGPIMGTLQGSIADVSTTLSYGALMGSLTFDNDRNNDGSADNASTLNQYWNFDFAALPSSGQNDFYSVALHELLHTIGVGTSLTWDNLRNGTNWSGSNALALNGGNGTNLVTTDGHLRSGLMSTRLSDGVAQEVVMDPTLTVGTRKYLTAMDAAFLRDLGYTTVPEPAAGVLMVIGSALLLRRRARNHVSSIRP